MCIVSDNVAPTPASVYAQKDNVAFLRGVKDDCTVGTAEVVSC